MKILMKLETSKNLWIDNAQQAAGLLGFLRVECYLANYNKPFVTHMKFLMKLWVDHRWVDGQYEDSFGHFVMFSVVTLLNYFDILYMHFCSFGFVIMGMFSSQINN